MVAMILLTIFLNYFFGLIGGFVDVLLATGVVVLMGTSGGRSVVVVGSEPVWSKAMDLTSKEEEVGV